MEIEQAFGVTDQVINLVDQLIRQGKQAGAIATFGSLENLKEILTILIDLYSGMI